MGAGHGRAVAVLSVPVVTVARSESPFRGVARMQLVTIDGIDPTSLRPAVGAQTYGRGVAYARQRAVLHMEWDGVDSLLQAVVRGSSGIAYETSVYFEESRGGAELAFAFGECTCPVGINCKHVVAAAVTATGVAAPTAAAGRAQSAASWEQGLGALIAPARPDSPQSAADVPLALELSLSVPPVPAAQRSRASAKPKLLARLVRPGRTGWVGDQMSWSRLGTSYYFSGCRASHLQLLRELYALHTSRAGAPSYYSTRDDKTIDLAAFDSRRLWPLLDEAAEIGLQLVHARKRLGPVERYVPGTAVPGRQRGSRSRLAGHCAGAADRRPFRRRSR